MEQHAAQPLDAQALGISLSAKAANSAVQEEQHFRWLLACLLFGKPIQQTVARQAYATLTDAGITSLDILVHTEWERLVSLLDAAHYVHYDYSTASKLLDVAKHLQTAYGTVTKLLAQSTDAHDLEQRLTAFRGIGPVTAEIFTRSVAPVWYKSVLPHDYASAMMATDILNRHGYEAYIIGGAVRDLWLGRSPNDFDLATNATPEQIIAIPEFTSAHYKDAAQAYGVTRVLFSHQVTSRSANATTTADYTSAAPANHTRHELEIATFRKDIGAHRGRKATEVAFTGLEDDVLRRDFTVNALALDPATGFIIDYVGGIEDLTRKHIRFIGDPAARIQEDPLRIMRAIRFKNHLGFEYHPNTAAAIKAAVERGAVETIAADRLRDELTRLLTHPTRRQAMLDLDSFGILGRVLPEVAAGKGITQPPRFHSEGDVWQHELLILDYLPPHPSRRLAWAALLHDIGKAVTRTEPHNSDGRIRFNNHYAVGAEMAGNILRRLRFSNRAIADITWMVHNHMAIDDLPDMRPSHQQRMLGHPAFEDLLELHRADAAASWRPGYPHGKKPPFRAIEHLWHQYQSKPPAARQPSLKHDLGIDGHWLLKHFSAEFGAIPGPVIGAVLAELEEWYRDEGVADRAAYVGRARELLRNHIVHKS